MTDGQRFGISGRLAAAFQRNPLTPILAIMGLLLGLLAVAITPREEEPQIDVTMANVIVPFDGASSRDVEQWVATPLEQKLSEIEGVKHVYSISRPGMAVLTVEFEVGVQRQPALVRLYNQVFSNADFLPQRAGVGQPIVKPKGIDDVPVMALTLWSDDPQVDASRLAEVAHTLEAELKRIPGTRDITTIGAPDRSVLVTLDAAKLAAYGMGANDLAQALQAANVVHQAGERVDAAQGAVPVTAGSYLASAEDVAGLVVGSHGGKPLLLSDVATIEARGDLARQYVWHGAPAGRAGPKAGSAPAVTIAIAKKPGSNASDITTAIAKRVEQLKGELIPQGVQVSVTRDYGASASDKASTLIKKLVFATGSVVLLVLFALGWREAIVVGAAVVLTLAVTLFASKVMGFTLNRVSLFALIFSIGILVDDAIVVVENIHRHMARGGKSLAEAIPPAVDEVGGPTILATFTVIAALMPMAFVSGLMGPYMRPIPINASAAMLFSLIVAFVVSPWLTYRLFRKHAEAMASGRHDKPGAATEQEGRLDRLYQRIFAPLLASRLKRWALLAGVAILLVASVMLFPFRFAAVKMLPHDNKSELQVVIDMPEGTTLERTAAVARELAMTVRSLPEVTDVETYVGTSAPFNFNGLVRHYFLRSGPLVADLQVNLLPKHDRKRASHDFAKDLRPLLAPIAARHGANVKVTEVPPGPPVLSTLVAEVYAPTPAERLALAEQVKAIFESTPGVVDVDWYVEGPGPKLELEVDREKAARAGVSPEVVARTLRVALAGADAAHLSDPRAREPVPVTLRLDRAQRSGAAELLAVDVHGADGRLVPLSELVRPVETVRAPFVYHKNLRPVTYVLGDVAPTRPGSSAESPVYAIADMGERIGALRDAAGRPLEVLFSGRPADGTRSALVWDGEWQVTHDVFLDMGIAFAAVLVLIYLLVVGWFRSFVTPMIIMAPIPLTLIGIVPAHALGGVFFTATSMIGFIALAGIIVRNSILLVDFVNLELEAGAPLAEAVTKAAAVRFRPIALTAAALVVGGVVILLDPIFQGLAVALISGVVVSTALTLVVIPLLYYMYVSTVGVAAVAPAADRESGGEA